MASMVACRCRAFLLRPDLRRNNPVSIGKKYFPLLPFGFSVMLTVYLQSRTLRNKSGQAFNHLAGFLFLNTKKP
jgi:hypothetical protein